MKSEQIPTREKIINEEGKISPTWERFFYQFVDEIEKRLSDEEEKSADYETRITALEP